MKRVPSGFDFGPHRITVQIVTSEEMAALASEVDGVVSDPPPFGLCNYDEYTIYVQKVRGKKFSRALQMHTFWHEYFHMMFHCAGRDRLSRDETLVDNCGALQLQAFNTAEF